MRIRLSHAWQRWTLVAVVIAAAALFLNTAARMYLAARYSQTTDRAKLARAAELEPLNATHFFRLGRYAFAADLDVPRAIAHYRHTVALDPFTSHYWLDLAMAYNAAGDSQGMRAAVDHALAVDPHTPENLWRAGNLLILNGDDSRAFAVLHDLLGAQPQYAGDAIDLAWRASGDADRVLAQVVPQQPQAQFAFLAKMLELKHPEAAERAWKAVVAGGQSFPAKDAFPYIDYLLAQGQGAPARAAWDYLAKADPGFAPYVSNGDLLVNGGFELPVIGRALGWRHQSRAGVTLDTLGEPHDGQHSLAMHFDGAPPDPGLEQWVPVAPNGLYAVKAFYKGELEGVSAPRLAVVTPAIGAKKEERLWLSDEMRGTATWQQMRGVFSTGPEESVVMLRVTREPGSLQLRGRLLLDDVTITREK